MSDSEETRIVIVDDSLAATRYLRTLFEGELGMTVVGNALDGQRGVELAEELKPDLVVMDIEMPVMNGFTALQKMRETNPGLPVVIFTSTAERHATEGLQVLSMPHTKWVNKAVKSGGHSSAMEVREELSRVVRKLLKVSRMGSKLAATVTRVPRPIAPVRKARKRLKGKPFEILAIGASTGGPDALNEVISHLPGDLPVPVVIVQHMPAEFTKHFAERLDNCSAITVTQGVPGERVEPGHVYLAPGGYHMVLERERGEVWIRTNRGPREQSCRPAVDPMFRSVAEVYGSAVLAAVLTGMGRDGADGCVDIREAGGRIVIQDEETSVVWGMPGAVHRDGLEDAAYPLLEVAPALTRALCAGPRRAVVGITTRRAD